MSKETAQFILERPKVAQQIYEALASLEEDVLLGLESALKASLDSMLDSDWYAHPQCDLVNEWWFAAAHDGWSTREGEDDEVTPLVYPMIWLDGGKHDDPIWTLLGVPIEHPGTVAVGLGFGGLFTQWSPKKRKALFTERMGALVQAGFKPLVSGGDGWLSLPLQISPEAVLAGLRDDEWDAALEPIREGWSKALEHRSDIDALIAEAMDR